MNQQINLYLSEFKVKKDPLTAILMGQILGGIVVLMVLVSGYQLFLRWQLNAELEQLRATLQEETRKTDELDGQLAQRSQNAELDARLTAAETRLESRRQIRDFLSETQLGNIVGFSEYFKDLSRASMDGLSLTEFSFGDGGKNVNIAGQVIASSSFTYLGEEFGLSAMLEAQNMSGAVTANYVDGFVKLPALNNTSYFSAFVPVAMAPDTDLSSRLSLGSASPSVTWAVSGDAMVNRGKGPLSGNLILGRQSSGAEDGPFTGLNIGLDIADSDAVQLVMDTDIDEVMPIANDTKVIASSAFRYGRLLIDNAFGPETEPLNIPLRVQYFDGTRFVDNLNDSSTTLFYDATTVDPAQRSLFFVPGSYQDNLTNLETQVEPEAVLAATDDVVVSLFQGRTGLTSETDSNLDNQNDDRPFVTSAPGETNEGRALIEFNLSDPQLPYSLNFLRYDWRGGPGQADIFDEVPEGANYNDNPRAAVEFGSYRGHDRVINWQEIYIGPSGP